MRKPDKGTLTFIFAKTRPIASPRYRYDFRYGIANDKHRGRAEKRLFHGCNNTSRSIVQTARAKYSTLGMRTFS